MSIYQLCSLCFYLNTYTSASCGQCYIECIFQLGKSIRNMCCHNLLATNIQAYAGVPSLIHYLMLCGHIPGMCIVQT